MWFFRRRVESYSSEHGVFLWCGNKDDVIRNGSGLFDLEYTLYVSSTWPEGFKP